MSEEPLSPLTWVGDFTRPGALPPISMDETGPTPLDERPADTGDGPFLWPTPPYAIYPAASEQMEHEPCEIEGLNGKLMQGRLALFEPSENLAHVQVPPSRTTLASARSPNAN